MKRDSSVPSRASNRRDFLRTSAVTAATAAAAGVFQPKFTIADEGSKGANERIGVGFIGTGSRFQTAHALCVAELQKQGRCEAVAVCDIYRPRVEAAAQQTGGKVYRDHKELLADPRVDVVCIAAPDRHHAPLAIEAIRAGKDVYCEKPLTHWSQMDLARQVGEEAQKHNRIVQVGTQYVADDAYAKVRELLKKGVIGKVVQVQAGYFRRGDWGERMVIPDANAKPGPDLDWDKFLGDAPKRPFDVSRFFQWRMYWDYAGGPATDLLVHVFTPIFCILDLDYPERVLGGGGTFQYNREVPDQCNIIADYAGGPSVTLMNSLSNFTPVDTIIRGTNGVIKFGNIEHLGKGIRVVPADHGAKEIVVPWNGAGDTLKLWSNLLDCVRSRKQPYCPIDLAIRVQAPLNMGVLAHRESKVAKFNKQTMKIEMA